LNELVIWRSKASGQATAMPSKLSNLFSFHQTKDSHRRKELAV